LHPIFNQAREPIVAVPRQRKCVVLVEDYWMLNPTSLVAQALGNYLEDYYRKLFGSEDQTFAHKLNVGARFAIEQIANSDALYHDVRHTAMVTIVGQEIFRGRFLRMRLTPEDWFHYTTATLCHDIGYVLGACPGDTSTSFVIDADGTRLNLPRGASDAYLTKHHIDRGKLFVRHRFGSVPFIDEERICRSIELTRFPVPDSGDHQETSSEAALVRAADLIGQLADPNYPQRQTALFCEFRETGVASALGYETAADLADAYPTFFWEKVRPYIGDALAYLQLTQEGKQLIGNLYGHVFSVEHQQPRLGPSEGKKSVSVVEELRST
jgi:hypothetical protein